MIVKKNKKVIAIIGLLIIFTFLLIFIITSSKKNINNSDKVNNSSNYENYLNATNRNTVINSINRFIYATVVYVNQDNSFVEENTIYAIPIECIEIEFGETSPLGDWMPANDNYFAYVLVQYDKDTNSYLFGYTFKDSNDNGMYPLIAKNIDKDQIKEDLLLTKPTIGLITSLTSLENWKESGFSVNSNTKLHVLETEVDGKTGDNINTCTLVDY